MRCVMTKWRCISALLVLGGAVGCATASNGGNPFNGLDSGGTDNGGDGAVVPLAGADAGGSPGAGAPSAGSVSGGASGAAAGSANAGSSSGGVRASGGGAAQAGNAGALSGGSSGTSSSGGAATAGTGGVESTGPCANAKDVTGGKSDNLGTTDAVCMRTTETFNTIGCSNWGGRSIKVNGVLATCNVKTTFAPMIDGFNYFEVSAGDVAFAAFVWYTS